MKAVVYDRYGPPDVLQLKEVAKPTPKENEVLVGVHAASVNYGDWSFVTGKPFMVRLIGAGLFKPKYPILGADIAGRVEAVGASAQQFRPGDEVYGDLASCGWGGFAEYVSPPEDALALKPANLTFEQAAAVPQAAVVALQGLRKEGQIQPGHKVLISGASGGIGTFAVQIAKSFGAEVTGVCSTGNLDMVRSLGADHVIDYTREDFTQKAGEYDLILDIVANRSVSDYVRALGPNGSCVIVGYLTPATMLRIALQGPSASKNEGNTVSSLAAEPSTEDLVFMKELLEAGKLAPVVDARYPLAEVAEAVRHYGSRHARGKIVIAVEHSS